MMRLLLVFLLAAQSLQAIVIKNDPSTASGVADQAAITGTAVTNDANTSAYRVDDQSGTSVAPHIDVAAGVSLGGTSGWMSLPSLWNTCWNTNSGAYTDGTVTAKFSVVTTGAFGVRFQLDARGAGTSSNGQPNSSYSFAVYPQDASNINWSWLKTDNAGVPSTLASGTMVISSPYTAKMMISGTTMMGTINLTPIPTFTDNTFSSGYYGFTTLADNVSITAATFDDGQPTPTNTPSPTPVPKRGDPSKTKSKTHAFYEPTVQPTPVRLTELRY